jgi:sigma-B regulation protein RsbU (phosphoserine phosphatase)
VIAAKEDVQHRWRWRRSLYRWGNSFSLRLAIVVNVTAVLVLAAFWQTDYSRERNVHFAEQADHLREEARVLRVAQAQLDGISAFQAYTDAYCRQMERHTSPGHHIIVTDASGEVIVRAHVRPDPRLESKMLGALETGVARFDYGGQAHMAVAVPATEQTAIVVGQSLAPMEQIIHRQAVSRAASVTVLVVLLVLVTNLALLRWVRRPIRSLVRAVGAIGARKFEHRVARLPTAEFRFLADGFNRMAESLDQTERRRRHELAKARRIHMGLLPPSLDQVPGLLAAARYVPADAVGGDYYDVLVYPNGNWLFVIADVSGHGVPAALVTAMLKTLIRQFVCQGRCPQAIAELLNAELELLVGTEHFITCLFAEYRPQTGDFAYVNCGHEPGLCLRADSRAMETFSSTGLPLAVDERAAWECHSVSLHQGDRVYLVTDGLIEAAGPAGDQLGRERLIDFIRTTAGTTPSAQVEAVLGNVRDFAGDKPFSDDVTVVIFQREERAG